MFTWFCLKKSTWFQVFEVHRNHQSCHDLMLRNPSFLSSDAMLFTGTQFRMLWESFPASLWSFCQPVRVFFLCELVAKNLCFCLFRVVIWATASTSHLLSGHRSAKAAPNTATPPNRWKRNWCFIFNLMQLSYYRQSFLHLLLFYVICDFCFVRSV